MAEITPEVIPPGKCIAMVGFNHRSTGPHAVGLTHHLTSNKIPTFCTNVYCPKTIGDDWQVATTEGIISCKYFIMLMSNGWQLSHNCQHESRNALLRQIKKEITIIPVLYDDFDKKYDKESKQYWMTNLGATQRADSIDKSPNDWMKKISDRIQGIMNDPGLGMYLHKVDQISHLLLFHHKIKIILLTNTIMIHFHILSVVLVLISFHHLLFLFLI
jgi:hypothetical protein